MVLAGEVIRRVQSRVGSEVSGKWRLERVLGIGGMAAVYAAVHRNQNRVAIKMLHPEQSLDEVVRTRFLREGYAANSVAHSGAVRVQDDGIAEDGSAFLVMELLDGETLEDRRERLGGRLPAPEVLALAAQLLAVLEAAHSHGIVHRDLKPDNLFLTTRGELKVLDFGIAHLRRGDQPGPGATSVGTFMGTPAFMPPEQARARWDEVDARSDLWAAGAVMFALLSGRLVHEAETISEQLVLAVQSAAPPLVTVASDVPGYVAEIVDRALCYEKDFRFPDAGSMRAAVRDAVLKAGPPATGSVSSRLSGPVGTRHANVDRVGDTMLAPSDGSTSNTAQATSLPALVTPSSTMLSSSRTPRHLPRSRGALLAVIALFAVIAVIALWHAGSDEDEKAAAPAPTAERPEVPPAEVDTPVPPAPSVTVTLNSPTLAPSVASSSARVTKDRPALKTPPKPEPVSKPAGSSRSDSDPFDKRF